MSNADKTLISPVRLTPQRYDFFFKLDKKNRFMLKTTGSNGQSSRLPSWKTAALTSQASPMV